MFHMFFVWYSCYDYMMFSFQCVRLFSIFVQIFVIQELRKMGLNSVYRHLQEVFPTVYTYS